MSVKSPEFKIGDLVVSKYADYDDVFTICKVYEIEYIDELSDYWVEGYDVEPYYMYGTEIVFLSKSQSAKRSFYEINDSVHFESGDCIPLMKYLSTPVTIEDYIRYCNTGCSAYDEE